MEFDWFISDGDGQFKALNFLQLCPPLDVGSKIHLHPCHCHTATIHISAHKHPPSTQSQWTVPVSTVQCPMFDEVLYEYISACHASVSWKFHFPLNLAWSSSLLVKSFASFLNEDDLKVSLQRGNIAPATEQCQTKCQSQPYTGRNEYCTLWYIFMPLLYLSGEKIEFWSVFPYFKHKISQLANKFLFFRG